MTVEVTKESLIEIRNLIFSWLAFEQASIKQIQSLLGKLNFVGSCVRPSRNFISRLLSWLRSLDKSDRFLKHIIPDLVKKDLIWWSRFLPIYNGFSMMLYDVFTRQLFARLWWFLERGLLSVSFQGRFWRKTFIQQLWRFIYSCLLEIVGKNFRGQWILVFCDNMAACQIINIGRSRCEILQAFL